MKGKENKVESDLNPHLSFQSEKEESIFWKIMFECEGGTFGLMLSLFKNIDRTPKTSFTKHENAFSLIYPHLERQVTFGTGPDGLRKWNTKKYTVDFLDKKNGFIFEIDGNSHRSELQILKDRLRDGFFYLEHGLKTIRHTNIDVEKMMLERIREVKLVERWNEFNQ